MKKVFVDANILVDYLDSSAIDHRTAYDTLRIILYYFGKPVISAASFIVCNYLPGKRIKNKNWHRQKMEKFFSAFEIAPILPEMIDQSFQSYFIDLEDALQHECALYQEAQIIITKNVGDYFASKIPVIHPQDFVKRYHQLFES